MISTAFIPLTQQIAKNDRKYFLVDNKFYDVDIGNYAKNLVLMNKMCILNCEFIKIRIIYSEVFFYVLEGFLLRKMKGFSYFCRKMEIQKNIRDFRCRGKIE